MNNVVNQSPFLRTSRQFPEDLHQIAVESNKAYVDVANAVNNRIISIFPSNRPAITGESWFINNQRQQTLRQIYTFTTTTSINHNVIVINQPRFVRAFGTYTDAAGVNSYALVYGTNVAVAGLITFYFTKTQIVFVLGAGAPTLASGILDIEWLSAI